jgi:hypothetical protein
MEVCLVRKLADCLDGVDVAPYTVGDIIDLPDRQARLLILEGWAVCNRRQELKPPPARERRRISSRGVRAVAADSSRLQPARQAPQEPQEPSNFQYDDCEERAARVAQTIEEHQIEVADRRRSDTGKRQKKRAAVRISDQPHVTEV